MRELGVALAFFAALILVIAGLSGYFGRDFQEGMRAFWGIRPAHSAPVGTVIASIYGPHDSGGRIDSRGQNIDPGAMTCAHRDLPFGTRLYLRRGHAEVEITITDRGPFVSSRQLDCTPAVGKALRLGGPRDGLGSIHVEPWPPLSKLKPRPKEAP